MDDGPQIEINVFTLAPTDPAAREGERPALPASFSGYRACAQDLMVTALLAERVVATGAAWLYEHEAQPRLMWVQSLAVDEPWRSSRLPRTLIDALLQTGKQMGVAQAYIEPALREHLRAGS